MDKDVSLKWKMPERPECFFGRERELEQIVQNFRNGNHVVFLQGIGGIGKSELAAVYALSQRENYEVVIFSNCFSDIAGMIASDVELPLDNMSRNTYDELFLETEEDYFERKYEVIKVLMSKKVLWVIDNFNCSSDPYLDQILKFECDILIGTRNDWSSKGFPVIHLKEIEQKDQLFKIFEHHYIPRDSREVEKIEKVISLVGGHTLVLEWIAKQLNEQKINLDDMIQVLIHKISVHKEGQKDYKFLYQMLSDVFQMRQLSEDEKCVLRFLCFVPYTGISKEDVVRYGKKGTHTAILKLLRSCWIKQIELDVISLHPIVAETVVSQLDPNWNNTSIFFNNIAKDLVDDDLPVSRIDKLLLIAENAFEKLGFEEIGASGLLTAVSHAFFVRYRKYDLAIDLLKKAYKLHEKQMDELRVRLEYNNEQNTEDVAHNSLKNKLLEQEKKKCIILREIGEIYFASGKYDKALQYYMKLNDSPIVDVYCDIAKVYAKVNEYKKAMDYIKAGIKVKKNKNGANEIPLIESYLLLATICIQSGDYRMAEKWLQDSLLIAEKQMNTREQSDFYYKYAVVLRKLGKNAQALEYDQKACMLRIKVYGMEHLSVIRSFASMSVDYYRLEDYVSALECTLREIQLRKKMRRDKIRLYLSVTRLVGYVDTDALPMDTQEELKVFMHDFNRILKENPKQASDMLSQ